MMKKSIRLVARAGAVVVLAASGLQAQPVTFAQGTFNSADWNRTVLDQTGGFIDNTATTAGGAEWRISATRPQSGVSSQLRVVMINPSFLYNPLVNGTLSTISFSFDLFGVSSSGLASPHFGFYRPIIRQNGKFFSIFGGNVLPTFNTWTTFVGNYSSADNWVGAIAGDPTQIDFTGAAGVLEFGWRYDSGTLSCSASVCSAVEFTALLDNYSVTARPASISTVPEPSTYALLLSGLAAIGLVARRRRVMM